MYASKSESVTRRLLQQLLYFILPAPCSACNAAILEPRESLGLCCGCRELLARWPSHGCAVCGQVLADVPRRPGYRCGACRQSPPPFAEVLSAWVYGPPIDTVLMGLKFGRLDYLGAQLGRRLASLFESRLADCEIVVPIPLHWSRYLQRGYNQATMISRPLALALGLPTCNALWRPRPTLAQSRLRRIDRQRNPVGAFAARRSVRWRGRHLLLVDDVLTTGATVTAAARCLLTAGAVSVTVLTAARTPES